MSGPHDGREVFIRVGVAVDVEARARRQHDRFAARGRFHALGERPFHTACRPRPRRPPIVASFHFQMATWLSSSFLAMSRLSGGRASETARSLDRRCEVQAMGDDEQCERDAVHFVHF